MENSPANGSRTAAAAGSSPPLLLQTPPLCERVGSSRRPPGSSRAVEAAEALVASASMVRRACLASHITTQQLVDLLLHGLRAGGRPLPLSLLLHLNVYCRRRLEASLAAAIKEELKPAAPDSTAPPLSAGEGGSPLVSLLESYARLVLTLPQTLGSGSPHGKSCVYDLCPPDAASSGSAAAAAAAGSVTSHALVRASPARRLGTSPVLRAAAVGRL